MNHLRITLLLFFGLFTFTPSFADWLALAIDDGGTSGSWDSWGIAVQQSSKKRAESLAMKQCNKNKNKSAKCRIAGSSDHLGNVVVATSKTYVQVQVDATLEDANRSALAECSKHTNPKDTCEIKWTGFNGVVPEQPQASSTTDCRPKSRELRCQSNCVNGDCVVEYENGCKIRVQVSPRFDSFSNQWIYPSPSC